MSFMPQIGDLNWLSPDRHKKIVAFWSDLNFFTVEPDQAHPYQRVIDLRQLYDFSKLGDYRLAIFTDSTCLDQTSESGFGLPRLRRFDPSVKQVEEVRAELFTIRNLTSAAAESWERWEPVEDSPSPGPSLLAEVLRRVAGVLCHLLRRRDCRIAGHVP
jgi:hypothetical protein